MALIADRFLTDEDGVIDLATGESVRLSIDRSPTRAEVATRIALCDRLAQLRHPLLVPLVDYGHSGRAYFEAHALAAPLRVSGADARRAALHLVRFLRAAGIELSADGAARHVRPCIEGTAAGWRPLGIFVRWPRALDAIRAVLECAGPPGVTALTICGRPGSGLRTARLQIARTARLAGFVVVDSRFGALRGLLSPPRHLCAFDWLGADPVLPAILSAAAASGGRRHVWIRFSRRLVHGPGVLELERLMTRDLMAMIYPDEQFGPTTAELRDAAASARGVPGALTAALSSSRGHGTSWVHETAPEYGIRSHVAVPRRESPDLETAGVARLKRAAEAAVALGSRGRHARAARVLARCAESLHARGAAHASADAWCALGDLHLARGRTGQALQAFERARNERAEEPLVTRALVGAGRAYLEDGRLNDAEAAFRTATLAGSSALYARAAQRSLAYTLYLQRRFDAAAQALGDGCPALRSLICRGAGDLAGAAKAAADAIDRANGDPIAAANARLAALWVDVELGRRDTARGHADAAMTAARCTRRGARLWCVRAEAAGALERCGVALSDVRRRRMLRAAAKLPPLLAARMRAALLRPGHDDPDLRRFVDASGATVLLPDPHDRADLIERFRTLVDAIHDTADEPAALLAIAHDLLTSSHACSVVIRSSRLSRVVATAGRAWAGEESLVQALLDGALGTFRDGVAPEAAEPVRAAGATLGTVAARWVSGANPSPARVRDLLRVAAAAAVPALRSISEARIDPRPGVDATYPDHLLGPGPAAERVRQAIQRAAAAPYPVLIQGESGSGKELVARAIHARSTRRARRFCAVNCAALAEDLLEAELFGHARGAFTGALAERHGLFEEADQGTLMLDEVSELSARAQAKLLRVLQEGEVRRIGENMTRHVDARVVAATNRSLEQDVLSGRFRADLRFRLDVIRIAIPPLRERADEVPWLAERFWAEAAARVGTRATLTEDVTAALARYEWPGNVRELQNVIASVAVHAPRRGRVPVSLLPEHVASASAGSRSNLDEARREFERRFVRMALACAGGRRGKAASDMGLTRQGLNKMIRRLGLES